MIIYKLPKNKLVYGPMQIETRISQDTEIARQLSLWDQRGSRVIRGNLLTIPIEDSLLYVEPMFMQASNQDSLPEMRRVIVPTDTIVMEETLPRLLRPYRKGVRTRRRAYLKARRSQDAGEPTGPGARRAPTEPRAPHALRQPSFEEAQEALKNGS